MSFITRLALIRRPVTILIMLMLFGMGVYSYTTFQRELFPEIEFPNIIVTAFYPNSDPETIMRDIATPLEDAISGISDLQEIQSTSTENGVNMLVTFDFGTDLTETEREIESAINGANLPADLQTPFVTRINTDTFPIMQFLISGDQDIPHLQRVVNDIVLPRLNRVEGVGTTYTIGEVEEKVIVSVDTDKLQDLGLSYFAISQAITQNNTSFPAGSISTQGTSYPVRTANEFGSLEDVRNLTIGFEQTGGGFSSSPGTNNGNRPIKVSDVADVQLTTSEVQRISRGNGKPSLTVAVLKDPEANTVDVTEDVTAAMEAMLQEGVIPPGVEVLELSNDGPIVREVLDNLLNDGMLGFLFAVAVVFIFLLNVRPSLMRGIVLSLRPTAIIAISIPLSVLTGILLMAYLTDISLNFMSLAGLAIAVGRVVDDSIVVLENIYRHIHLGEDRFEAALNGTREVGAAIVSSTLSTVAIFVPLAFISGVVGEFFSPFAISVSLALIASTAVAITIVPVLGASLLRRGDFSLQSDTDQTNSDTMLQRIYTPILLWTLRHKFITITVAILVTISSLGLLAVIPIVFFPSSTPESITVDINLPIGTSIDRTYQEALEVEKVLEDFVQSGLVTLYQTTVGGTAEGNDSSASSHIASIYVGLPDTVPENITDMVREAMPQRGDDVRINITDFQAGPGEGGLEVTVTGNNFNEISDVARRLEERFKSIEGVINLTNSISDAKQEVVIDVDPTKAGEYGLNTSDVGSQVNQLIVGREISEIDIEGSTIDIVLRGEREDVNDIQNLKNLRVAGQSGQVPLGLIANISIKEAPTSIFRIDSERSAIITGTIDAEDTAAVGVLIDEVIADLPDVPRGVTISSGGIFEQINQGFQDIFLAMAIGIALVYLVMVASLGALRTPFIIILSLPLAVVGAMLALFVTDRSLSLSALMGFLLLTGIIVTNAIVLLIFVEQLRERGFGIYEALIEGGRVRLRPILMTAFTTTFALFPLAISSDSAGIIGAELATVVIGGLVSSTFLTLLVVPSVYWIFNVSIPSFSARIWRFITRRPQNEAATT